MIKEEFIRLVTEHVRECLPESYEKRAALRRRIEIINSHNYNLLHLDILPKIGII